MLAHFLAALDVWVEFCSINGNWHLQTVSPLELWSHNYWVPGTWAVLWECFLCAHLFMLLPGWKAGRGHGQGETQQDCLPLIRQALKPNGRAQCQHRTWSKRTSPERALEEGSTVSKNCPPFGFPDTWNRAGTSVAWVTTSVQKTPALMPIV